jgi:hypothetical protein
MFQKDKCENQNTTSKDQVMEYHTDEEELSRETMDPEEKQEEKKKCLIGNVTTTKVEQTEQTKQPNMQKKVIAKFLFCKPS